MTKTYSPQSEQELCELVCQRFKDAAPIRICGGSTKLAISNNTERLKTLDKVSLSKISGIKLYEPASLTLIAGAGTSLAEIEALLASEGQHLAFEPADYRALLGTTGEPTIGGIVASGISGPRRIQAGACRDALIGVRFVTGEGAAVKNGGRVMKNVTGYDLVKLMCGAYGTLGVLSEVSFKLLPHPQYSQTLVVHGLSDAHAVTAMCAAMASPYDVTGAAHIPATSQENARTYLRIEGFEKSVASRIEKLKTKLIGICPNSAHLEVCKNAKTNDGVWADVRDCKRFAKKEGCVWRISVAPTNAPDLVKRMRDVFDFDYFYDWSGGLVWLNSSTMEIASATLLRNEVTGLGGHATLIRRGGIAEEVKTFHNQSQPIERMSNALRNKFDPAGILNPALMD